jgi:hypothetical protein
MSSQLFKKRHPSKSVNPDLQTKSSVPLGTPLNPNSPIPMLACSQNADPKQASPGQKHVAMNVHGWRVMCTESCPHV